MIVIRACHDIQTSYLYYWSDSIIKRASEHFDVVKVEGEDISEKIIRSRINRKKRSCIFFNGHGNQRSLVKNRRVKTRGVFLSMIRNHTLTPG